MRTQFALKNLILLSSIFVSHTYAAKPVQNPNPPPIVINQVSIDGQMIHVYGEGLTNVTQAEIAGTTITDMTLLSDTELQIPFSTELSNIVTQPGSYQLIVNSTAFSFYSNSVIPDPVIPSSCPCESAWQTAIGSEASIGGLPLANRVDCPETGADIAATITVPTPKAPDVTKQFIFGASFYGTDHSDTHCSAYATGSRYVELLGGNWPFIEEIEKINNITLGEQNGCAEFLKANICKP